MLRIISVLCLTAFGTAQAGTIHFGGTASDTTFAEHPVWHASVIDALDAAVSSDSLVQIGSSDVTMSGAKTCSAVTGLTVVGMGLADSTVTIKPTKGSEVRFDQCVYICVRHGEGDYKWMALSAEPVGGGTAEQLECTWTPA